MLERKRGSYFVVVSEGVIFVFSERGIYESWLSLHWWMNELFIILPPYFLGTNTFLRL